MDTTELNGHQVTGTVDPSMITIHGNLSAPPTTRKEQIPILGHSALQAVSPASSPPRADHRMLSSNSIAMLDESEGLEKAGKVWLKVKNTKSVGSPSGRGKKRRRGRLFKSN